MKKIVLFVLSLFLFWISFSFSFWNNDDNINKKIFSSNFKNRQEVVQKFCKEIFSYQKKTDNLNFINAKNSIFLKVLCNTTWIYTDTLFKEKIEIPAHTSKYYKKLKKDAGKDSLISFWLFWKCKNNDGIVVDKSWLNNVNFVCVANDIWNKLASDEINLWSYIVYWWFNDEDWLKKWEKDFFYWAKSKNGKMICSDWYFKKHNDDNECEHTETYNMLKSTQWDLRNILHNLNFFPRDMETVEDIEKKIIWTECNGNCDFALMTLRDSIYNELYFYVYFLSFYWQIVKDNTSSLQLKKVWNSVKYVNLNTSKEFIQAKRSIITARLSLRKSFDLLKNIYWTYPIHVWLLAIIEDFKKLRDTLAKIYTPIDQLRYKLQNVQDLSKH